VLHRPPPRRRHRFTSACNPCAAAKRKRRRLTQEERERLDKLAADKRDYRHLIEDGGAVLDGLRIRDINALTEALVDLDWLPEEKSEDRKTLLAAVGAVLDDIASPYRRVKACPVRTDKRRKPRL
jgi:hypothetical protein